MTRPPIKMARMGRARKKVIPSAGYSAKIALRVRELREQRGLTVQELATKLGVSANTVYAWESGRRVLMPDSIPSVARALGCKTAADFFPSLR